MKNLRNLGKILNKQEQQSINGGSHGCAMASSCNSNCIWECVEYRFPKEGTTLGFETCYVCVDPNQYE
tara:strand:- start:72 stop:275 length:204 start_codon:yes stop_codon:yes gene_type:complete